MNNDLNSKKTGSTDSLNNEIYSFKETSTCNYEIVVVTHASIRNINFKKQPKMTSIVSPSTMHRRNQEFISHRSGEHEIALSEVNGKLMTFLCDRLEFLRR